MSNVAIYISFKSMCKSRMILEYRYLYLINFVNLG